MDLIKLSIRGVSYSQNQTGAYVLLLEEDLGSRKLPVIIGSFEAQSIALALEKDIKPPRPLTHDLFVSFAKIFNFTVKSVILNSLIDGVFYSNIIVGDETGLEKELDSRTSDAIAIAVRFNAPIYVNEKVMRQAGVEMETEDNTITEIENKSDSSTNDSLQQKTNNEISIMLENAISREEYELAAKLRDELEKRG